MDLRNSQIPISRILWVIGFLWCSCASNPYGPYSKVDDAIERGDYERGLALIEENKGEIYREKDALLYYLDKGMIAHYAEQYGDSAQLLQAGEQVIEKAFTKSVTMSVGSYLVNDKIKEYDGDDYEDIYINVFNALNYYHQYNVDDALVEIKRMSEKLQFLASKYEEITNALQRKALEDGSSIPPNPEPSQLADSALARYLGMLFYRGKGKEDDARIDRDQLKRAFAKAAQVYRNPAPLSIDGELDIPPGKARLNVIGFGGLSPLKQEETTRIPLLNSYIKIALPVMVSRPSRITRVELVFYDGTRQPLELLEDMDAVARETFKEKARVIYLKSVVRAAIKGATVSVLDAAGDQIEGEAGLALALASVGAQIFAEASEQADLRMARYFPSKAYIGGLTLDPGSYSFKVQYYGSNGSVIASFDYDQVEIQEKKLNLVEAVCLQ